MASNTATSPLVILHLGLGSFHRAHQAVYLHDLIPSGDTGWVLAAGNTRPDMAETIAALKAQGGEYTLETVTPAIERTYTRVKSIKKIIPYQPTLAGLIDEGASAATRIVSFTVTEAGYYLDAHDRLDLAFHDLAADLQAVRSGRAGSTIYGALTAILKERMRRGSGRVTLLNCDNLRHNGDRSRKGLLQFLDLAGESDLRTWVETATKSPNSMVDRITPRPDAQVRDRVRAATGRDDPTAIMAESFIQWVIEDDFCNGRPAWEKVGAEMVKSVAPYEEAKIRILNASHSCIAWAGTLKGYRYIHEGTHDAGIRQLAHDYVTQDVIPCLHSSERPSPVDLPRYRDVVLERFGNPAICDTNGRVAMDGYSKIPGFIAPTVRERLRAGSTIDAVAVLPALFLLFLRSWHRGEVPYPYEDQAMDAAAVRAMCESADPIAMFCADKTLWGPEAGDVRLVEAVRSATLRVGKILEGARK